MSRMHHSQHAQVDDLLVTHGISLKTCNAVSILHPGMQLYPVAQADQPEQFKMLHTAAALVPNSFMDPSGSDSD